jgi:hypothetical protein
MRRVLAVERLPQGGMGLLIELRVPFRLHHLPYLLGWGTVQLDTSETL